MSQPSLNQIVGWFQSLQSRICSALELLDGAGHFTEDKWDRKEGGGGISRVIQADQIEKGGVMFSHIHGNLPESIAKGLEMEGGGFDATGVSIVLHPANPWVPIIHMNVRYFETDKGTWWFGGGIDVTPHYIIEEDAHNFHLQLKAVCDKFDQEIYVQYKTWADDYFYNIHRKETRGIGGIFFDRLNDDAGYSKEECWQFVRDVGDSFITCYTNLFKQNINKTYTERHVQWRNIRRSRYVEFNLVYDRGTRFGLQTDGRIESILMSMPPQAEWKYDYHPLEGSDEAQTLLGLVKGKDWINGTEV